MNITVIFLFLSCYISHFEQKVHFHAPLVLMKYSTCMMHYVLISSPLTCATVFPCFDNTGFGSLCANIRAKDFHMRILRT